MPTADQKTELKRLLAKVTVSYYNWRQAGFPADHPYHGWVEMFDSYLHSLE